MRSSLVTASVVASIVLSGAVSGVASPAQSPDERAAARAVVKKQGDAVVTVTATVKLRVNVGGRDQPRDQPAQANATVLDNTGLAVTSLSTLVPDALYERGLTMQMPSGTKIEVSSEVSDMKIRTADGREVAAKLVLKDDDLDLAFVRPTEPVSPAMPFVDAAVSKPGLLDLLVLVQRTTESTGWATGTAFGTVQLIIDKPRTYYLVAFPSMGGAGLGSPFFDTSGKFVGVILLRNTGQRGSGMPGVLPAEDIREVAKQAK
jgi:hypothetical protein